MPGSILYDDTDEFADGTRYEMIVYEIETSKNYPEGERYSFQYMEPDGTTLLRYDNYTEAHGHRHHRHHYQDGVTGIEYEGWDSHVEKFYEEMDEVRNERH